MIENLLGHQLIVVFNDDFFVSQNTGSCSCGKCEKFQFHSVWCRSRNGNGSHEVEGWCWIYERRIGCLLSDRQLTWAEKALRCIAAEEQVKNLYLAGWGWLARYMYLTKPTTSTQPLGSSMRKDPEQRQNECGQHQARPFFQPERRMHCKTIEPNWNGEIQGKYSDGFKCINIPLTGEANDKYMSHLYRWRAMYCALNSWTRFPYNGPNAYNACMVLQMDAQLDLLIMIITIILRLCH